MVSFCDMGQHLNVGAVRCGWCGAVRCGADGAVRCGWCGAVRMVRCGVDGAQLVLARA
jgi:transcription elongation factor Elf1